MHKLSRQQVIDIYNQLRFHMRGFGQVRTLAEFKLVDDTLEVRHWGDWQEDDDSNLEQASRDLLRSICDRVERDSTNTCKVHIQTGEKNWCYLQIVSSGWILMR